MEKELNNIYIKSLDNIIKSVLSNISIEDYFTFNAEKKITSQYLVLKFINKSLSPTKNNQERIKFIINALMKRCGETEIYELAEISKDIKNSFDTLFDMVTTTGLKTKRTIKTNKTNDI